MIRVTPLRRTTLQCSQMGLTLERTFKTLSRDFGQTRNRNGEGTASEDFAAVYGVTRAISCHLPPARRKPSNTVSDTGPCALRSGGSPPRTPGPTRHRTGGYRTLLRRGLEIPCEDARRLECGAPTPSSSDPRSRSVNDSPSRDCRRRATSMPLDPPGGCLRAGSWPRACPAGQAGNEQTFRMRLRISPVHRSRVNGLGDRPPDYQVGRSIARR
jgi:hypothetical protein